MDEHLEAYAANTYSETTIIPLLETRKLEGKLDALVILVTQLATNQKSASIARVCDIRSSNDHHTSVCPSSQQSRVDDHPEAFAANTYNRLPQQQRQGTSYRRWLPTPSDSVQEMMPLVIRGVHNMATITSALKLESWKES
ncbi:hypothetical protein Fmac_015297 [Flemingia macrophylla]|uniref:Uncharacterized protein n=1 Tax=Flemingia macrophylla TaxID=520843 RepID=A0ABD1MEC2_9FABA